VCAHHAVEAFTVADVDFIKGDLFARQLCHAIKGLLVRVAEVVDDHGVVARRIEFHQSVAADETGAACD